MRLTIIGSGPGGYVAALKAAKLGADVTVVEDTEVGGTCLNRGCIPTKTLAASAEAIHKARNLEEFGIEITGNITPNLSKIIERKNSIVSTQIKGIKALFKNLGVNLIEGRGMFLTTQKIEVQKKDCSVAIIETDKVIIATGSRPAQIPIFPFDGEHILSSTDALNIREIPKKLIIVGAGVIGCEFACIFSELGTEVIMVEMMQRIVSSEDPDISKLLERELIKKGIKIIKDVIIERVEGMHDGVHLFLSSGAELKAEKVLVSVGRTLNSDGIGLEAIGIKKGPKGEIIVNNRMETNIEGIYAVGDVTGGWLLAHVASKEGIVAACNACGVSREMDYSVVPSAIFTSPEIGSVGLRENQAEDRGIKIKTGNFQFRLLGRSHAIGEITGIIKVISDADTDKILGAHIIGPHASDLIHEAALAIKAGLTTKHIADMIHAHPTLSEGLMEAAGDVHGDAIHKLQK